MSQPDYLRDFNPYRNMPGLRGFRVGGTFRIESLYGMPIKPPFFTDVQPWLGIAQHAAGEQRHWRATLHVREPDTTVAPALAGGVVRFNVTASLASETITRTCTVGTGDSTVIYAPGANIAVTAQNPTARALEIHYQLDEFAGGISAWRDMQVFEGTSKLAAETALTVPNFCAQITVYNLGAVGVRLRGYSSSGVLVYDETFAGPSHLPKPRIPGLRYTLTSAGAAQACVVYYDCVG